MKRTRPLRLACPVDVIGDVPRVLAYAAKDETRELLYEIDAAPIARRPVSVHAGRACAPPPPVRCTSRRVALSIRAGGGVESRLLSDVRWLVASAMRLAMRYPRGRRVSVEGAVHGAVQCRALGRVLHIVFSYSKGIGMLPLKSAL